MDEILQKLLESELLSEDVKSEISQKWKLVVEAKTAELKEQSLLEARAELAEKWVQERDSLIESVDTFVTAQITEELAELRGDIDRFRDLEAEFAQRIVEEKEKMASQLQEDLDSLVEKIDAFFEVRLHEEFAELQEDLEIVKQNQFGKQIFEAFVEEFSKSFVDEESVQTKLNVTESKLADAAKHIAQLEADREKMVRESKIEQVLRPLTGSKREQMAFVLQNVETQRLEEAYNQFIGRILKEDKTESAQQTKLNESKPAKVVTGEEKMISEQTQTNNFDSLRALAGIGNR